MSRYRRPPTQVEDPEACAAGAESVGEGEHVLGGSPEPVQCRDDESVALDQRVQRPVELRPGGPGPGDAMVDVEVIPSDPGGQKVCLLPVGGLLPG